MEEKRISMSVVLPPSCLNEHIETHVKNLLHKQVGTCTQDRGYLVEIKTFKIVDTEIARASSDIVVHVIAIVECLRPQIGGTYPAVVSACIKGHGVYAHCHEKLKVLIMERYLENAKFENGKYTFSDSTKQIQVGETNQIQVGDTINVTIQAVKYEKNNFQCIGKL